MLTKLRTPLALSVVLPGICIMLAQTPVSGAVDEQQGKAASPTQGLLKEQNNTSAKVSLDSEEFEEPEEAANCLQIHGNLTSSNTGKASGLFRVETPQERVLVGSIEMSDGDATINSQVKFLTETALNNSSAMKDAQKAYDHFRTLKSKTTVKTKDTLQILTAYRGFASSKEAGDIILDESLKLNGLPASELALQKEIDNANGAVIEALMQVAMGLGLKDPDKQTDVVVKGFKTLAALVGEEKAQISVTEIAAWNKRLKLPDSVYKASPWSPSEQQEKAQLAYKAAQQRDPHIAKAVKKVHGYNKKSKLTMAASHVIEGGLGVACLVPSAIGPAAQVALTGFEMATGGSEENKLLKQIYLSKRIQSRNSLLKQKINLALQNYQLALLTQNPALLAFSESLIAEMSGEDTAKKLFGQTIAEFKEEQQSLKKAALESAGKSN